MGQNQIAENAKPIKVVTKHKGGLVWCYPGHRIPSWFLIRWVTTANPPKCCEDDHVMTTNIYAHCCMTKLTRSQLQLISPVTVPCSLLSSLFINTGRLDNFKVEFSSSRSSSISSCVKRSERAPTSLCANTSH